jgi:dTMP kinase
MQTKGLFISFEGPDGSGKSTIVSLLTKALVSKKYPFQIASTREPGGHNNVIAEDIRNILLNKIEYKIADRAETLLFAASRAQHVKDFIDPNLRKGNLVICDRYIHSSLVYQGYARGLGMKAIWDINQFAINDSIPDLTIIMMINPEEGLKRIKANNQRDFNRLDRETITLHEKVYQGYRKILDENHDNKIVEIDASRSIEQVYNNVLDVVTKAIDKHYAR